MTVSRTSADSVQMVADTIIESMFAPHELPLDDRLATLYREVAQKVLDRLGAPAQTGTDHLQAIHDEVNALGGRPDQDNSYDQGIVDTVAKVLEIIEKAQATSPAPSSWQPIDTAPKTDRTTVVVWDDPVMGEAYYDGEKSGWWWANTGPGDYTACAIYPTLWQPMPIAPPSSLVSSTNREGK